MAPVDEWRIGAETDAVIAELTTAIAQCGLHATKFNAPLASISGPEPWDDGPYRPFWEAAVSLRVPVFFTLGTGLEGDAEASLADRQQSYLNEQRILMRWMERYPDTVCSLTHGFPWRVLLDRIGSPCHALFQNRFGTYRQSRQSCRHRPGLAAFHWSNRRRHQSRMARK
jgi:hypothetical protein